MLSKANTRTVTFLELNFLIETFENFPFRIKFSIAYEKLTHVSQKQRKKIHKTAVSKSTPNFNANTLSIKNPKSQNLKNYKGLTTALNIISISKFKKKMWKSKIDIKIKIAPGQSNELAKVSENFIQLS